MNRLIFIGLLILTLGGTSCTSEESIRKEGVGEGTEQILLRLPLTSVGMPASAAATRTSDAMLETVYGENSREIRVVEDSKIDHLCVFLFSGTSHKLINKVYIADVAATETTSVDIWLNKSAEEDEMIVLANAGDVTGLYAVNNTTLDQFRVAICPMETAGDVTPNNLVPMIGTAEVNTASGSLPTVALSRLIAKLNFTCKTELAAGGTFDFTSITLKNVPTFVKPMSGGVADPGAEHLTEYALANNTYVAGTLLFCFLPENMRGRNEAISDPTGRSGANVPENATYVEVRGSYVPSAGSAASAVAFSLYLGNGELPDFNIERNCTYTVKMTIKAVDGDDPRVEVVTNLSANKTANCYMVTKSNGSFSFNGTVKGNGSTSAGNTVAETKLAPKSAKVLWEMGADPAVAPEEGDVIQKGSVALDGTGQVSFKSGAKPGNAVIAVYDGENGTGNILWSWHIWKPETEPKPFACRTTVYSGDGSYSGGSLNTLKWTRDFDMMDCNLGAMNNKPNDAKAYGFLYQWGRKDPFPGAQAVNSKEFGKTMSANAFPVPIETNVNWGTIEGAVQHPTQFLWGLRTGTSYRNWLYGEVKNEALWGNPNTTSIGATPNESGGSKSIYDPCPPGWRVPPSDTWCKLKVDKGAQCDYSENGALVNIGVNDERMFFPAPGSRYHLSSGDLKQPGIRCVYFTSSSHINGGDPEKWDYVLIFAFYINDSFTILSMDCRSAGASIRCTSEP